MEEENTRKIGLVIGALVLAAIAVVGVVTWLTGSWPAGNQVPEEPEQIAINIAETPTPSPNPARIPPEAAISVEPEYTPAVAGVSVMAETGPAAYTLLASGVLALVGLGSSLLLTKFA